MQLRVDAHARADVRFAKLRALLGWRDREVFGLLTMFWQDTQTQGVVSASKDDLCFYIDADAAEIDHVFASLVTARYIKDNGDGSYVVVGNDKHVGALENYKRTGRERVKSQSRGSHGRFGESPRTDRETTVTPPKIYGDATVDAPKNYPPVSVSVSVSDPDTRKEEYFAAQHTLQLVPVVVEPKSTTHAKTSKPKKPTDPRVAVFARKWFELYRERYKKNPAFGDREGNAIKHMLGSRDLDRLLGLAEKFFEWPNAQVIRAGHGLVIGPHSFQMTLDRLEADLADYARHNRAYEVLQHEREALERAHVQAQNDRLEAAINFETQRLNARETKNELLG